MDGWSRIVFEGDAYRARGYSAAVPDELLTLIGTTTETSAGAEAEHAEVYAIEGVDPDIAVIAVIRYVESAGGGSSTADLYLMEKFGTYSADLCEFFDPDAMGVHGPLTPEECR